MVISQRNGTSSVTPTDGQYVLDRWIQLQASASKYSVQQNAGSVTPPNGFRNYLGVTSLSAYTVGAGEYFMTNQRIEGFNVADLNWGTANARTVTISFWVRSSLTGTFGGSLTNGNSTRSYPYTYTISAANTWEYKTITIPGDTTGTWATDNATGMQLKFSLGMGSSLSGPAGAWAGSDFASATGAVSVVGTNGATWYITGVQLEVGTQATTFTTAGGSYGAELALCQRYYEKSYPTTIAVPTNSQAGYVVCGLGSTTYFGGSTGDVSQNLQKVQYMVTKRTSATVTTYSYASSTTSMAGNGWTGADLAAGTAAISSPDANGFNVYNASGSNRTVNSGAIMFHFAASAEL
jgi:hypothetical protein